MRVFEIKQPGHPSRPALRITQTQGATVLATVQMTPADQPIGSRLPVVHTVAVAGHRQLTSKCLSHCVGVTD
jgi:hypothetical protein